MGEDDGPDVRVGGGFGEGGAQGGDEGGGERVAVARGVQGERGDAGRPGGVHEWGHVSSGAVVGGASP